MEEQNIKAHPDHARRPADETVSSNAPRQVPYYIFKAFSIIFKFFAIGVLIFSMQNISDIIRGFPSLNSLPPFEAFLFSYLVIQLCLIYVYMIMSGSVIKYFVQIIPTLIHFRGFLIYTIVMPFVFTLSAGAIWWSSSRFTIAEVLSKPFSFFPSLVLNYFEKGLSFEMFIALNAGLLVLCFLPVMIFHKLSIAYIKPRGENKTEDNQQALI